MSKEQTDAKRDSKPAEFKAPSSIGSFSVTAPKFSGEESFERFSADLDTFFSFHNFNDEVRLRFLPLCLTGVARDAYDSLSQDAKATIGEALAGLRDCFSRPSAVDAHARLRELRFDPRESLDVFLITFRKLVKEAFPGSDGDVVLFNCFLAALPEDYRVDIVSQGMTKFADAVERTRNLIRGEKLRSGATVRQVVTAEPSMLDQIMARLDQLERQIASSGQSNSRRESPAGVAPGGGARASAPRARSRPPPGRACFGCGSRSHLISNCRHRNSVCFRCNQRGHISSVCSVTEPGNGRGDPVPERAGWGPSGRQ